MVSKPSATSMIPEDAHGDPKFKRMLERVAKTTRDHDQQLPVTAGGVQFADESDKFYVEREFGVDEFAEWFSVQTLGTLPFNAIGYHHTYVPGPRIWVGLPSLRGIFNYYHDTLGWDWGLGPHIFVYSGDGQYSPGVPRIYVATHPAHDGAGIVGRNGRWLHIEHIWNGDDELFSEALKRVSGQVLAIVCAQHPHANREIPLRFVKGGEDNPSQPVGIMYHRDQNPSWVPGAWPKSCPGLKITHDNLDRDVLAYAAQYRGEGNPIVDEPVLGDNDVHPDAIVRAVSEVTGDRGGPQAVAESLCHFTMLYGINTSKIAAQVLHETNYLRFTGDVKPDQNNFAGIKTADGAAFHTFASVDEGIEAICQHHLAYVLGDQNIWPAAVRSRTVVDPRLSAVLGSEYAHSINKLGDYGNGKWAEDPDYATKIASKTQTIREHQANNQWESLYFPQTRAYVGGGFKTFCENLGDRELQTLGLPLRGEEDADLSGIRRVQCFERGVLAHFPENSSPWDVVCLSVRDAYEVYRQKGLV